MASETKNNRTTQEGKQMITTYTQTMMMSNERLQKATIEIEIFVKTKYESEEPNAIAEYKGLTAWDIIEGGEEAKAIEAETDENSADEHHEYLVLHFNNGETATFRNSHVNMFIRR
jgi:hypothetical protein